MIRVKGIHQGYVLSVHATSMFYKNRHDNQVGVILKPASEIWFHFLEVQISMHVKIRYFQTDITPLYLSMIGWLGCMKLYAKPKFKDIEYLNPNN